MSGSYSLGVRERAIKFVLEEGGNRKEACRVLGICYDTLTRWLRRYREQGNVKPNPRIRYRVRKVDVNKLTELVEANPDSTLCELGEFFGVYPSTIDFHLRKLKITRKKNHAVSGAKRGKKASI